MASAWLITLGILTADVGLDEMRRAVDRAFTAELAGDLAGARTGVEQLLETSSVTGSARIRARDYLANLDRRQTAFEAHGLTRSGFAEAFATLRNGPTRWSELLWRRAVDHVPELSRAVSDHAVRVRSRRVRGDEPERVDAFVVERLRDRGISTRRSGPAPVDLSLDLDASDVHEDRHRHRARAEGSYILRGTAPPRPVLGHGVKEHEALRDDAETAQAWASRRVLDDLVDAVAFDLRLAALAGGFSLRR